jgi:sensor histidine kinase YesM
MNGTTLEQNASTKKAGGLVRRSPLPRLTEGGLIAVFWVTVALLTIAQKAFDPRFSGQEAWKSSEALFTFSKYMIWVVLTPSIFWLIRSISQVKSGWQQLLFHGLLGIAASAIVHYIYHILWNFFIPESPQSKSILFVLSGLHFLPEFFLYLIVLGAGFARDYFLRYRERMQETARLQAESASLRADAAELRAQLADARLQALHMQIHPHFLFNTLHTITAYIERDPAGTRRIITLLSELLRYTFEKTDVREVTLAQELDFLNKYFEIQSIRFQDRLDVRQDIEPGVLDALVPTLILQPLIENAIKHGISAVETVGRIDLRAWREGGRLHLSVRDNGPGLLAFSGDGASATGPGIGLQNTRRRLATLYRDEQRLVLENAPEGGAIAQLTLPFHTHRDLPASVVQT